jgi:hypothetical protein
LGCAIDVGDIAVGDVGVAVYAREDCILQLVTMELSKPKTPPSAFVRFRW